ncbi:MAG: formate dehydrogenase accessory sulfurtransferase FdhD [Armatimonadetes bacterium]|nr:formate dehydrogenase accessory sulfurtransferase FdhD [Armatimonadota bacterium]
MTRPGSTTRIPVHSYREGRFTPRDDLLTTEEPLEIRLAPSDSPPFPLTVTMRTPGHDFELSAGLLFAEGILAAPDQIRRIAYCREVARSEQQYNVVTVELRPGVQPEIPDSGRRFGMTAACGVCGKTSLEALKRRGLMPMEDPRTLVASTLLSLPAVLREQQTLFNKTGGIHAAALFDEETRLVTLREDVGRHNAMDKIVGERFLVGKLPIRGHVLLVSGRPGFEIVQKAAAAGIPILAGVSAPSSLAVETAREFGMTLIGFLREDRFNVYSGEERVTA